MSTISPSKDPYAAITEDLTYSYEGIFSSQSVAAAVDAARLALEPASTVQTYLPVLVARQAREQLMAAAMTEHLSARRVHVRSAGSAPSREINPMVVDVLAERGISLVTAYPKPLSDNVIRAADVIITMGCGDACPIFPGKRYEDWDVADPADQPIEVVRDIRDDIQARVTTLLREILN